MNRIRPILRWPGGKSRLLKKILPLLPPHTCYCEPFAGGLAVLLAKQRSPVEVVNDLHGDLVYLYRNAQYHLPALLQEIEWTLNSRENLRDFIAQPGLTEIQRAARWLIRNRISYNGNTNDFGVSRTGGGGSISRAGIAESLRAFNARMDRVAVEHLPYERCLKLYDGKETFFFVDPPYLNSDPHVYEGWDEPKMAELKENVFRLEGRWLLTVNDSTFTRKLFKDCRMTAVRTYNGGINHAKLKATFGELIIRR
jgi:DNA adenine methylase